MPFPLSSQHETGLLDSVPEFQIFDYSLDSWQFFPQDWKLITPNSAKSRGFPFEVAVLHRVLQEEHVGIILTALSEKWLMDYTPFDWADFFGRICSSGMHNRDVLFLWRALLGGFFTEDGQL
ncbi:hypothetical protein R1sor_008330 [Riccia sorocarpa]|uniref:Uncharacterized protein n=1 Tax=Riccia sorocarpa TaxID=122646 RepID=A0ABD3HWI2_9MARC